MNKWIIIQSPTDPEMYAVQCEGHYVVADDLPIDDAYLIAAAPDLLAQLKSVLACIELAGECTGNMQAIRAAIAKAEC